MSRTWSDGQLDSLDDEDDCDTSTLVNVTELVQLTNLGISITDISWSKVRMSSDRWICVRRYNQTLNRKSFHPKENLEAVELSESDNLSGGELRKEAPVILTLLSPYNNYIQSFEAHSINSAQVNPVKPIIALSSVLCKLYLICLYTNKCVRCTELPKNTEFWSWVNEDLIGVVTSNYVFHWNTRTEATVTSVAFKRDSRLDDVQITNYEVNGSGTWAALSGLYINEDSQLVSGIVQVHCFDYEQHQCIQAHCVKFTTYKFQGNMHPSNILLAAKRVSLSSLKIFIVELGPFQNNANNSYLTTKTELILWSDSLDGKYDFPVAIVCNCERGFIYIFSKYGFLSVADMQSGSILIDKIAICPDVIFQATLDNETQGAIVIARNGQVLSVDLQVEKLVDFLQASTKSFVMERLRDTFDLDGDEVTRL